MSISFLKVLSGQQTSHQMLPALGDGGHLLMVGLLAVDPFEGEHGIQQHRCVILQDHNASDDWKGSPSPALKSRHSGHAVDA